MTESSETMSDQQRPRQGQEAERLVLSPSMHVEQIEGQIATIYLQNEGTRIRIPKALFNLLFLFEEPATIKDALGANADNPGALKAINSLREKKFLLAEDDIAIPAKRRPTTDVPSGLFDCPPRKITETSDDVVFLGVPYDLGDMDAAGARNGPVQLREVSLQILYGLERKTGRPRGWYDADRGRPILKGISLGDYGDVFIEYGEPQHATFSRITETLEGAIANGALPVLVGGDSTISLPAIKLVQAQEEMAVLTIGRYRPARAPAEDGFITPHTLPGQCQALPNISHFVQLSPFDKTADLSPAQEPGHSVCQTDSLMSEGVAFIKNTLPGQSRIFLCLDFNALASPADKTGFHYQSLHEFIAFAGSHYEIVGVALTGINPKQTQWHVMAMIALNLLLTAIDSATGKEVPHA